MSSSDSHVKKNALYRHVDGGFYRVIEPLGKDTDKLQPYVVYTHVWPFEKQTWLRPANEWTPDRFELVDRSVLLEAQQSLTKLQAQDAIAKNKAARRAAQGK